MRAPLSWMPAYAVLAASFVAACGEPFAPATQWLEGTWRWTGTVTAWAPITPDAPNAKVLTLASDGTATLREYDRVTLKTGFRARNEAWYNLPIELRFAEPVFGANHHYLPRGPSNTLVLGAFPRNCEDCQEAWVFVRMP